MENNLIKNHRNKNNYYFAGNGLWVRDFTKKSVIAHDINNLIGETDTKIMLVNEIANHGKMFQRIDTEDFKHAKIVIVGGGANFTTRQVILDSLPQDVIVMGVAETLDIWTSTKKMHYYIVNNPYEDCMSYYPRNQRVWPRCIASTRTFPQFLEKYNNIIYEYSPVIDSYYGGLKTEADYFIDDYRNPICAAIALAYRFGVQSLFLFSCDDAFSGQRPAAIQLPNDYWIYPQQLIAHKLVDANLYWLKSSGVKIGYNSFGPEYNNAIYIKDDEVSKFFT